MSVIEKLAYSLNRRDEVSNQQLAKELAGENDSHSIQELVENCSNKNKNIQSDCIKVLYEIALLKPQLVANYIKEFISLLDNKNNRMVWGALTAIDDFTLQKPKEVYAALPKIIEAADKGSVISRDHCVGILIKLSSVKQYAKNAFSLLLEQLKTCPTNQLPMYTENAMPVINKANKMNFINILQSRMKELEKETQKKRMEKVIKKLSK